MERTLDLVITDADGAAAHVVRDFSLDMQWGDDDGGNDFELSGVPVRVPGGALVYVDGTEYGGIVDAESPVHSRTGDSISYSGRTWHGALAQKVLMPPSGQSHYVAAGEANAVLAAMVAACPVGEPVTVSAVTSGLTVPSTQLPRFCTLYEAMRRALRAAGARLSIVATKAGVELSAVPSVDWGDLLEPGRTAFSAKRHLSNYNHLIALGKGELTARQVLHLYADADGNVSTTQSITGIRERTYVYELSSEEGDELAAKARQKLQALQESDEAEADLDPSLGVAVGDRVTVLAPAYGISCAAEVTGMVVKVERGIATAEPKTGSPQVIEDKE